MILNHYVCMCVVHVCVCMYFFLLFFPSSSLSPSIPLRLTYLARGFGLPAVHRAGQRLHGSAVAQQVVPVQAGRVDDLPDQPQACRPIDRRVPDRRCVGADHCRDGVMRMKVYLLGSN